MWWKWSAVVILLACGLFAEAQIAAPTAEPEEVDSLTNAEDDAVHGISAPTEAPAEEDDAASQIPTEAPQLEASEAVDQQSSAVKRALTQHELTLEEVLARKVELCEMEAREHLAALATEFVNFTYFNETDWVYANLGSEFEVVDGLAECKYKCEDEPECERWVYMCGEGRGLCKLHSHGGGATLNLHSFMSPSADFQRRNETAELRTQAAIAAEAKARSDALRQELQEIEDGVRRVSENAKAHLQNARAKHAGHHHAGGDRRLESATAEEDIFGEGEL